MAAATISTITRTACTPETRRPAPNSCCCHPSTRQPSEAATEARASVADGHSIREHECSHQNGVRATKSLVERGIHWDTDVAYFFKKKNENWLEWHFGSYRGQARQAFIEIKREFGDRVDVTYGQDPYGT
ncbi:hypothetical protein F4779DRAFT_623278 [Xylariaceae sp. FL0662B]|nr:hypothetical protein F4779DRAFT_623278 [Xylariaceae sp. FL0662B]